MMQNCTNKPDNPPLERVYDLKKLHHETSLAQFDLFGLIIF